MITKPFTQAALSTRIRDIIDASRVPGRILLVEDELLIQMLATEYLEEAGFQVDTAGSATEAMNKLGSVPGGVDAVIVDIGLPDRKGDVLIREIRAVHPTLPIVLATGQDAFDLQNAFKGQEKVAFLTKPYSAHDLLGALRMLRIVTTAAHKKGSSFLR